MGQVSHASAASTEAALAWRLQLLPWPMVLFDASARSVYVLVWQLIAGWRCRCDGRLLSRAAAEGLAGARDWLPALVNRH